MLKIKRVAHKQGGGGPGGKERKGKPIKIDPRDKSVDGGLNNLLTEDVRVS